MTKKKRRVYDDSFKARVALDAIKQELSLAELSTKHDIHPNQISHWKKEFLENAANAFNGKSKENKIVENFENEKEKLHQKIGELSMELAFAKKNLKKLGLL